MAHRAFIGIGSNLGDRKDNYREACEKIAALPKTRIVKASSMYESEPIGDAPKETTWFVNGVIEIETEYAADQLLKQLQAIEATMGRKRVKGKKWGSRIIDLDILLFGKEVIDKRNLKVPHPEMQNRRFVLLPLSELVPQLIHPKLNVSVNDLLNTLKDKKRVHLARA